MKLEIFVKCFDFVVDKLILQQKKTDFEAKWEQKGQVSEVLSLSLLLYHLTDIIYLTNML